MTLKLLIPRSALIVLTILWASASLAQDSAPVVTPDYESEIEEYEKYQSLTASSTVVGKTVEVLREPNLWEVGTDISFIRYEEPGVMEEDGLMYGIYGVYTHRIENLNWVSDILNLLRFDGKISFGKIDYESVSTGSLEDIDDVMLDTRVMMGYDYYPNLHWRLTPYFGFGFRYLSDDSSGHVSSTGHHGYLREIRYYYLPVGLEAFTAFGDWKVGLNGEFDIFVQGRVESHLNDVNSSLPHLENTQKEGFGLRGSIKLIKMFQTLNFTLEPYVKYWYVEDSNLSFIGVSGNFAVYGLEPENNSTETGVKVGIQF